MIHAGYDANSISVCIPLEFVKPPTDSLKFCLEIPPPEPSWRDLHAHERLLFEEALIIEDEPCSSQSKQVPAMYLIDATPIGTTDL